MTLTFGSLFAGIGGFDLGFERAGMQCKWQVEIDPYCQKVLAKHWPNVRRHDDIRTFPPTSGDWSVDIICGGFPCTDLSYAAINRPGLDGSRSGLFFDAIKVVRTLRPRFVIMENVPALLDRWMGIVLRSLADCGLDAVWRCFRTSQFGAPHIRDRVFILGYRRELCCPVSATWSVLADPGSESRWIQQPLSGSRETKLLANGIDVSSRWCTGVYYEGEADTDVGAWAREPRIRRVGDGFSNWMDRRRTLGNAVSPVIAEWIGNQIVKAATEGN
jgi:DNA (cytosine-5)-methyltransferase 1